MTRVLITGSRDWHDWVVMRAALRAVFEEFGPPITIVHGAARGADSMAEYLGVKAHRFGVATEPHRAKWDIYGKRAGHVRNALMVELGADICLAFIKDGSPGATGCALLAEHAGIPVRRFIETTPKRKKM